MQTRGAVSWRASVALPSHQRLRAQRRADSQRYNSYATRVSFSAKRKFRHVRTYARRERAPRFYPTEMPGCARVTESNYATRIDGSHDHLNGAPFPFSPLFLLLPLLHLLMERVLSSSLSVCVTSPVEPLYPARQLNRSCCLQDEKAAGKLCKAPPGKFESLHRKCGLSA